MTTDEAQRLFGYTSWANALMFRSAGAIPPADAGAPAASSFPSLCHTLAHIAGGEWVWLRRWLGDSPPGMPDWVANPDLADVRRRLGELEAERGMYLGRLSDDALGKAFHYRLFNGKEAETPLGELFRHVVNHSTYHRGQAATQMRQLGHTPPSTDYVRFLREASTDVRPQG